MWSSAADQIPQASDGFTLADLGVVVGIIVGAVTVFVLVGLPILRLAARQAMDDVIEDNEHVKAMRSKLESVDRAVNQSEGRRLTERVDDLAEGQARNSDLIVEAVAVSRAALASADEMRGEVRRWRAETMPRAELARLAAHMHPDIDPDDLVAIVGGDRPDLTVEQAREIAARRNRDPLPDNPEEHPR